jgi:hypothetical protein
MRQNHPDGCSCDRHRCCGGPAPDATGLAELSRRTFLGTTVLAGTALTGAGLAASAGAGALPEPKPRRALVVKPVLIHDLPTPRPQTIWRSWGGIQTEADVAAETTRIANELRELGAKADFPVKFLPVTTARNAAKLHADPDVAAADVVLVYAAGGGIDGVEKLGKHIIFFLRHQSGPVSLWYEIVSPRFLRQHTDDPKMTSIDAQDVVVDKLDELTWRLRSLCGLTNTVGSRIVAIGGAGGWAQPTGSVPDLVRKVWKIDIREVGYPELAERVKAARADSSEVALAERRTNLYLSTPGTSLKTDRTYVHNALLLEQVFRHILVEHDCRAITINQCMGTIMPVAETSACLSLSTLNDAGYMAFCESDFVVIPAGMLLSSITGRPFFMNDPTFPHDGLITLAHCTSARKLDGRTSEPATILSHFESDYGASPKVEMKIGQTVTNVVPDFAAKRWVGVRAEVVGNPFLPICRSQVDVKFACDSLKLAERMPGFHWMTIYGDCTREVGYALKKVPITWECLG